ncbi:MAG: tetratricopeptide repeat protein [Gemmataceae bacterium]|nr:tetratricopeptide repeat protein [Gemmataceae bacterium]
MANKLLFVTASMALFFVSNHHAVAGEEDFAKELVHLNALTGSDATRGAFKMLVDDPKKTKALLAFASPLAKKSDLSYNAALVFGLTAAEMKDMKSAEVFFRVCMDRAVKLQSFEKMKQSYGLLIELNFDYKNYADASRLCRELLELNTEDGKQRLVIGMMVDRFGQLEFREPQDSFDTAQRLRPYVYEIYIKSTTKQGKFDQAIKLVDGLLKKNNDWIDRHLKGWVLREAGKFADAATVYEDVIKQVTDDRRLEPEEKDIYIERFRYEVSNVYVDLKQIDRASEHLEYLVKKRPNDPVFYNDLGFVWADNNMKLEEAEKLIRKALELDRERRQKRKGFDPKTDHDNGAYLDSLGWVLFKQKKNDEAKKWLIKALEDKNAQHIEIYDHLGDVHIASGERDLAIKAWQKGLEVVTDNRRDQERKVSVERKIEKAKSQK